MNTSITNHVGGYSFEIRDKLKKKRICELNVGLTFAKGHAEWLDTLIFIINKIDNE